MKIEFFYKWDRKVACSSYELLQLRTADLCCNDKNRSAKGWYWPIKGTYVQSSAVLWFFCVQMLELISVKIFSFDAFNFTTRFDWSYKLWEAWAIFFRFIFDYFMQHFLNRKAAFRLMHLFCKARFRFQHILIVVISGAIPEANARVPDSDRHLLSGRGQDRAGSLRAGRPQLLLWDCPATLKCK